MSSEWYDYYRNHLAAEDFQNVMEETEEALQVSLDPDNLYEEHAEKFVEFCHWYGDSIAEGLRGAVESLREDLDWWKNEVDEWEEDTSVVVRFIADTLGRADMPSDFQFILSEQWLDAAEEALSTWESSREWTLPGAAVVIGGASKMIEAIGETWNEYQQDTREGAGLGIRASQFAIKTLSNRIAPGSGAFVVEFVNRANGL